MILRLIPLIISWLILAAHFLRYGNILSALLCIMVPLLLIIPKRIILHIVQWFTFAGVLLWIKIGIDLVKLRFAFHDDYYRLAIIMTFVALFTFVSGLTLYHESFRRVYR
ncbi:MAG: hypothetical protein ACE5D0_10610 [Fidelibacterota bacterium]